MSNTSGCLFVLFGATGDLAKRKLLPALYNLFKDDHIAHCAIIGVGLEQRTVEQVLEPAREFINDIDEGAWQRLHERMAYCAADVSNTESFASLAQQVALLEKQWQTGGNRLFYCATATQFFGPITRNLAAVGLLHRNGDGPWQRVVYEKPFGHDEASAKQLNEEILAVINESQVFRIDHYLAKEVIANIAFVRFTNRVFEPLWDNGDIEWVQIFLSETGSTAGRAGYYDHHGVINDVVQNHMLQLLALIAMEAPAQLTGDAIRDAKVAVLEKVRVDDALLGQYVGYRDEPDVQPESQTPTLAALRLSIDNERWRGVPFFLKTGKCLSRKETKIHIKFKPVKCLLPMDRCPVEANYLTITIFPEGDITLTINVKEPGKFDKIIPVNMEFCHSCLFGPYTLEAYETIFLEIINGEQAVSVRSDEIELSWRIVDLLRARRYPLHFYEVGSTGPAALEAFANNHNIRWR